jgi:hypothetical protein
MSTPTCARCGEPIDDPAERWPEDVDGDGKVCQMCWEGRCARLFWEAVDALAVTLPSPAVEPQPCD